MLRRFSPVAVLLLAACGGDPEPRLPATIEAVAASDGQSAPAGGTLADPLEVTVRAADGLAVSGAEVAWAVTDGAGAVLSDSVTLSDGVGRAQVFLTLGTTPGGYTVRARLTAVPDQAVTLNATAGPPPQLSALTPTTFGGGDTLVLTGTALSGSAVVEVGGRTARLVTASATSLTVLAPHCLVAGPVQVRARVQGAPSNTLTATFTAPAGPLALAPGDFITIDPAQAAGCATFPAAGGAGAEYLVTVQAATGERGLTHAFVLRGDSVPDSTTAPGPSAGTARSAAVRFHDFLRAEEAAAARRARPAAGGDDGPPVGALQARNTVSVGDERAFRVCSIIECQQVEDFAQVTARARWVGQHAAIFVDKAAPAQFPDSLLDSLGRLFDDDLYEVDTRAFGAESDVDNNGVVAILFTPQVNGLTPQSQCGTSIITGFFFGIDIDPVFQNDPRSNKGEVFYALAPDPTGSVSCSLTADQVRRFVQVTFVHEFQHMISYNQHVLQRNGDVEELWLNEAMSHLAEELAGFRFEARGDENQFSRFVLGDLFNGYLFLEDPVSFFVLPAAGTGSLEERGASWLFLRWMVDQFGDHVPRRLAESRLTGQDNVEAVTGEPFDRLLTEWMLATYLSDLPGFTAPARLRYTTWQFRATYQSLHDQLPSRFPRPFPIVPTEFTSGTGILTGTLRSGSGAFVRVVQPAGGDGFTLSFTGPGGAPISSTMVPRMSVVRIR